MTITHKTVIAKLVLRGFIIMLVATAASSAIVAFACKDMPTDMYWRSIMLGIAIPMVIAPPISFAVGRLNYKYFLLHLEVERLANCDDLTGLLNRRALREVVDEKRAQVSEEIPAAPVILFLADIDHFKGVNDRLGHDAGDYAIQHVAAVLRQHAPQDARVARIGGEEFAILCDWTSVATLRQLSERLRVAVADTPCQYGRETIELTISLGVAIGSQSEKLSQLMHRADRELYAAKDAGRNCYSIAA